MNHCPRCQETLTKKNTAISVFKRGHSQFCRLCRSNYDAKHYEKNKEKLKAQKKGYRDKHRKEIRARDARWYKKHKEERNILSRRLSPIYGRGLKEKVCLHYGKGEILCQCVGCHVRHIELLTIDHIVPIGRRRKRRTSVSLYLWLIKKNFPKGYQILCGSCNLAKRNNEKCPLYSVNH